MKKEQRNKKTLIIEILIALIILIGIIITLIFGLNYDLKYQASKNIELYIEKEFEVSDIRAITNEVMPNQQVLIQKVEIFEDTVSIISKDITEEQKSNLITKINEKYGTELSTENVNIVDIPHTRGRELVKQYIKPLIISTLIILIYFVIRYYKLIWPLIITRTVGTLIIVQALLLSIIAITRVPVGKITMSISIFIYILTLFLISNVFEKELKQIRQNEED